MNLDTSYSSTLSNIDESSDLPLSPSIQQHIVINNNNNHPPNTPNNYNNNNYNGGNQSSRLSTPPNSDPFRVMRLNRAKLVPLPELLPIKILSLGGQGVGKSSLIKTYCEERVLYPVRPIFHKLGYYLFELCSKDDSILFAL